MLNSKVACKGLYPAFEWSFTKHIDISIISGPFIVYTIYITKLAVDPWIKHFDI